MDFVGCLNFANPVSQTQGTDEHQQAFAAARLGRPILIHDARASLGAIEERADSTALLANGAGFLLVHAPSAVKDWTDTEEVAAVYYEESRVLLQKLLPTAEVPPTGSHTYRNEQIKDHYWDQGVQYGPCATAVHNDYADFVSADRRTVTQKFTETQGTNGPTRLGNQHMAFSVTGAPGALSAGGVRPDVHRSR